MFAIVDNIFYTIRGLEHITVTGAITDGFELRPRRMQTSHSYFCNDVSVPQII